MVFGTQTITFAKVAERRPGPFRSPREPSPSGSLVWYHIGMRFFKREVPMFCGACADIINAIEDESNHYKAALEMIANHATTELNPDGLDQAAWSMQLIAQEALA